MVTNFLVPYHMDEFLPELDVPVEPEVVVRADLPEGDTWRRMSHLYESVAEAVAADVTRGSRPLVQSGDCTTSFGVVAGLQRAGLDPGIVWFDAHGDVQTLETTASGYVGGMALRVLLGYGRHLLADRIGLSPVPEERVVLVDARDLDPPEEEYLAGSGIRRAAVEELGALPDGPLYLHVDFDVVDPDELPGLLFPAEDGPWLASVGDAVRRVVATGRVAAFGVGCTWHPGHGAAELVRPLVSDLSSALSS